MHHLALRVGCDRVFSSAFRRLPFDVLLIAYIRPSTWWGGQQGLESHTPVGRVRKSWFWQHVLTSIHHFAAWIHHTIHTNLGCCSRSVVSFPFSLSYKSIIFKCSFKNLTKCKSKTIEKRQGLQSKLIDLDLKIHLPKSCCWHPFVIEIWCCNIGCVQKNMVVITYSSHCFAKYICFENK